MCAWYSDRSVHVRVWVLGEGGGGGGTTWPGVCLSAMLCRDFPVNCTQGWQTPPLCAPHPPSPPPSPVPRTTVGHNDVLWRDKGHNRSAASRVPDALQLLVQLKKSGDHSRSSSSGILQTQTHRGGGNATWSEGRGGSRHNRKRTERTRETREGGVEVGGGG